MNPVVLVTGCSTGIGREICEILSRKHYIVVASAREKSKLEGLSVTLKLKIDVTNQESIEKAVQQVIDIYGKIDILVNNAGYSIRGAIEEMDMNQVKKIFEVNVFGVMNMIQAVVPYMREAQSGKIINIGSISGKLSQSLNGSYCASKHAVEAISDALRLELYRFNIQSTVIEPGAMQTQFFKTLEKHSNQVMNNVKSPYYNLYLKDIQYRKHQKRADSNQAAQKICCILERKKFKPRYKIVVPIDIKVLMHLPTFIKEWILLHH